MNDGSSLPQIRNAIAQLLAAVVAKQQPDAKLGSGQATHAGFLYDFLLNEPLSEDQLEGLDAEVARLIADRQPLLVETRPIAEARAEFTSRGQSFLVELLDERAADGESEVDVVACGDYLDLALGPLPADTSTLPRDGFRLDRVSGAYWKGSDKFPMMSRVEGLVFEDRVALDAYLAKREEAAANDHRRLGQELDIFMISDGIGRGLPVLLENGATIYRILERFIVDEEIKRGYQHVLTPVIGRKWLYETSGHLGHFEETMYPEMQVGADEYMLRPMTCPHHFMIYKDRPRSYRELPLKIAEVAALFRKEHSGGLTGLIRILTFHLADAHIFIRPQQLKPAFKEVMELIQYVMKTLGIESQCRYRVSLRDGGKDKYIDDPEAWKLSEASLVEICEEIGLDFDIGKGEAAFYGPKLDVQMYTTSGREETLFTNQIDLAMSERFDLSYIDEDDNQKRPWIIHRSSLGCLERTLAFLLEYYKGAMPLWLSPVQVALLPIGIEQVDYAYEVDGLLRGHDLRTRLDIRNESLNRKVRDGRTQKIPYLAVIGAKEVAARTLTVTNRDTGSKQTVGLDSFVTHLLRENAERVTALGEIGVDA